jgi:hypothetical protein
MMVSCRRAQAKALPGKVELVSRDAENRPTTGAAVSIDVTDSLRDGQLAAHANISFGGGLNRRILTRKIEEADMRTTAHCMLLAALAAFTGNGAVAASSDYLLTLPPGKGEVAGKGEQIEVQSFHWGPRQTTSADGSKTSGHSMLGASDGVAAGDVNAAGPAEKRQHGWSTVSKPLARGSLTVQGSLPGCTVGKRYSGMQLAAAAVRYELKDVVITACTANIVSLDYAKVTVRGWNPEPKQE